MLSVLTTVLTQKVVILWLAYSRMWKVGLENVYTQNTIVETEFCIETPKLSCASFYSLFLNVLLIFEKITHKLYFIEVIGMN